MKKWGKYAIGGAVLIPLAVFAGWASSPDPKFNPASFEKAPLSLQLAPLEDAVTLAQFLDGQGRRQTMLVRSYGAEAVTGIDLRTLGARATDDVFEALASADLTPVLAGDAGELPIVSLPIGRLLAAAPSGTQHIGTGTNFPEHAQEANSQSVFQFPKFGRASPARTKVRADSKILLDYEVELCVRFDRDIKAIADFDTAVKGFFLCGDFTNRNALINLADPDNLDSGRGFSDAKSGPDFFPTGPFLVVPTHWAAFVGTLRMTTAVNGTPRQDARGSEMTLDFRALTQKALGDMAKPRFLYRDRYVRLMPGGAIAQSAALMSGTSEGTIFTPPSRADLIEAMVAYALKRGESFMNVARKTFIANELAGGHYLQPGDTVRHASNWLGEIRVEVVE